VRVHHHRGIIQFLKACENRVARILQLPHLLDVGDHGAIGDPVRRGAFTQPAPPIQERKVAAIPTLGLSVGDRSVFGADAAAIQQISGR